LTKITQNIVFLTSTKFAIVHSRIFLTTVFKNRSQPHFFDPNKTADRAYRQSGPGIPAEQAAAGYKKEQP